MKLKADISDPNRLQIAWVTGKVFESSFLRELGTERHR
jgi:hypothetical protein